MTAARVLLLTCILATPALARNVDLSTVPRRDTVQLTIYNAEDLTLVRETRTVTFKKGPNPLQFSWANTLIDPTSVHLKFLTNPDKLDVQDTTFPHDKPQMLYWNVASEFDGEATIEITYFTSGISWSADYVAIADKDETQLAFDGFVRIHNNSGEPYDDAQIRLVVGTINLVEKIAQLARVPMNAVEGLDGDKKNAMKRESFSASVAHYRARGVSGVRLLDGGVPDEKEIIKEGLSEYFIYTIEGTETIPNGWSKRLRSFEAKSVPFKVQYRYRPQEYGEQLVRMYILTNDAASKLGITPLPDGVVRAFRDNGRGGLSFLAAQTVKYIPIGDKIELNLGPDPNVALDLVKLRATRDDIWLRVDGTGVYRRLGGGAAIEINSTVAGWDDHERYAQRIRNATAKPIDIEIRRSFPGHVEFTSKLNPILFDFRTPQFTATIPANQKRDLLFEITLHQGRNAKQNNVTLRDADVKP